MGYFIGNDEIAWSFYSSETMLAPKFLLVQRDVFITEGETFLYTQLSVGYSR